MNIGKVKNNLKKTKNSHLSSPIASLFWASLTILYFSYKCTS